MTNIHNIVDELWKNQSVKIPIEGDKLVGTLKVTDNYIDVALAKGAEKIGFVTIDREHLRNGTYWIQNPDRVRNAHSGFGEANSHGLVLNPNYSDRGYGNMPYEMALLSLGIGVAHKDHVKAQKVPEAFNVVALEDDKIKDGLYSLRPSLLKFGFTFDPRHPKILHYNKKPEDLPELKITQPQ
ncbi:hypothetical protein HYS31_01500 [Candidatus Woesearchaeota archaeon]|nr:hypothetical protein [Candidatus Woesearchaeota archaeon]